MWVGIVEVSATKVIEPYVDIDTLGLIQCNGREKMNELFSSRL